MLVLLLVRLRSEYQHNTKLLEDTKQQFYALRHSYAFLQKQIQKEQQIQKTIINEAETRYQQMKEAHSNTQKRLEHLETIAAPNQKALDEYKALTEKFQFTDLSQWVKDALEGLETDQKLKFNSHGNYLQSTSYDVDKNTYKSLPRIAFVTLVLDGLNTYKADISALGCYCATHGYAFFVEPLKLLSDRYVDHSRQRLVQKYLPYYQWVVYINPDTIVADRSKKIEDYLPKNYDVVLHWRENKELTAGGFAIKNSDYGRNFLEKWIALSDGGKERVNRDTGDLNYLVLKESGIDGSEKCIDMYDSRGNVQDEMTWYKENFIKCSWSVLKDSYLTMRKIKLNGLWAPTSFYRQWYRNEYVIGRADEKFVPDLDLFVNGKKNYFEMTDKDVLCLPVKDGITRPDLYFTIEEARMIAKQYYGF
jgi:hypothetical protein